MEQATNQFNKGLQMDTHPMVQGNDTLTDCLNGTLITMNGNEVILLNDMGNRRVDNAFLPPGYLPVGMKEYGGIIYIAAYNPITNKSQIGSFPSPERKIDSIEYDDTPTALFDFDSFFDSNNNVELDRELGISVLKSDSFMVPISNNVNIHSGDKFVVYSSNLSKLKSNLTNYNNLLKYTSLYSANSSGGSLEDYREMAYSPKNRKYTLLLGILNSLNEFVDITKTLCRWEKVSGKWSPKEYNSKESDLSIFNDGYFIPDDFSDPLSGGTIDDKTLIKERLKIPANTYSYKLVGPIYLKASLNHISLFNYNLYGVIDENNDTLITIEGVIVYNCLDGVRSKNKTIPDSVNYFNFEEGTPNENFGFDFMEIKKVNEVEELIFPDLKGQEIGESVYDEATNTYKVKITKTYNIGKDRTSGLFSYVIGVKALYDKEKIYLRGCSVRGLLDLSLLGTGTLQLKRWKFSNGRNSSTISYRFNYYKKVNENISNLRVEFTNLKDESNVITYNLSQLSGTEIINWGESYPFVERAVYKVSFKYNIINKETKGVIENGSNLDYYDGTKRWFLTTSLFNEFFNNENISDFCSFEGVPTNTVNAFKEKMEIPFTFSFFPEWTGNSESDYSTKIEGGLISKNYDIKYKGTNTSRRWLLIHSIQVTPNLTEYPSFISLGQLDYSINHPIIKLNNLFALGGSTSLLSGRKKVFYDLKNYIEIKKGSECNLEVEEEFDLTIPELTIESTVNLGSPTKIIELKISNSYGYCGYNNIPVPKIYNAFLPYDEVLEDASPKPGYYGRIFTASEEYGGIWDTDDRHWIHVIHKSNSATEATHTDTIGYGKGEDSFTFDLKDYSDQIYLYFNNGSFSGQMFMYSFFHGTRNDMYLEDFNRKNNYSQNHYARVWWRTSNNKWALIPNLLYSSTELENLTSSLEKQFFKFLFGGRGWVYCIYDTYNYANDHKYAIYAAENNYIYTKSYSIPVNIIVDFNLKNSENILTTTNYGNLEFSILNLSKVSKEFGNVTTLTVPSDFMNKINTFDYNSISNVYLTKALLYDKNGNALSPNIVYLDSAGTLVSREGIFIIDRNHKANGKNTLLVGPHNLHEIDTGMKDWGDSPETCLNYNGINMVEVF